MEEKDKQTVESRQIDSERGGETEVYVTRRKARQEEADRHKDENRKENERKEKEEKHRKADDKRKVHW